MIAGFVLALIYFFYGRFPGTRPVTVVLVCRLGRCVLRTLLQIQNDRERFLTGKTAFAKDKLNYFFSILGFLIGLALPLFGKQRSGARPAPAFGRNSTRFASYRRALAAQPCCNDCRAFRH